MKKLALAIAVSAAATAAQAQQTTVFTGNLNVLESASAFSGGGYAAQGTADIDYTATLVTNFGSFSSLTIELDGNFSTAGAAGVPAFAQNTWTFTDATYLFEAPATTGTSTVIGAYEYLDGSVDTNGGTAAGGSIGSQISGGLLQSGTAVCSGSTSCSSLEPDDVDYMSFNYYVQFGTFIPQSFDLVMEWISPSGGTGYKVSTNPVPVPAAAWLFGSALVGLAGIGRKRKAS